MQEPVFLCYGCDAERHAKFAYCPDCGDVTESYLWDGERLPLYELAKLTGGASWVPMEIPA